jgi:hypothetical protein
VQGLQQKYADLVARDADERRARTP